MSITDPDIKRAMRTVETSVTLNDGAAGRGAGSLLLVVRRRADGGVTAQWFARTFRNGKPVKKSIGRYPDMTLAQARQFMAAEVSPSLQAGKALRVAYQGERPTVQAMFQGYVESMKSAGKASADEVERMLLTTKTDCAADVLGRNRLACEVEPADVADLVARFYRRGHKGAADKMRSYVSSAFNWARKNANDYKNPNRRDWGIKGNPAEDVPRDPEAVGTRERNLSAEEIRQLWNGAVAASEGFSLETAGCIRLLIGCGQRVEETLRVDGAEIDLATATWNMPRHKTKMKMRPHSIPLPRQVLPVLAELIAVHGDGPLFPSRTGAKAERITPRSVRQAVNRWLASDGVTLATFQPRDLRRTWKSRTGEIGISKEMRDLIQQHAKDDTGSVHYDRADYMPQMREAMAKWEAWLDKVLELQRAGAA